MRGRLVAALNLGVDPGPGRAQLHGRLLQLRQDGVRGALLVDGPCRPELTDFSFTPGGPASSRVTWAGPSFERLVLISPADRLEVPVTVSDGTWQAFLPATGRPGTASLRWLRPGRWRVVAGAPGVAEPDLAVHVSARAEAHLGDEGGDRVQVLLRSDADHELGILADGGVPGATAGVQPDRRTQGALPGRPPAAPHGHHLLRGLEGPSVLRQPARHLRGAACAAATRAGWCGPSRTTGSRRPTASRRCSPGAGTTTGALGRARWVVSNDSMPKHYAKREGSHYGQTWHGTPLKRIGFDIENLQMANKNYLKQFAKDVAKWDALVSPNAFSTEILRRAFRYDGPVLETGYPRNDVFHRPAERAERTAARARAPRHRARASGSSSTPRPGGTTSTTSRAATSSR